MKKLLAIAMLLVCLTVNSVMGATFALILGASPAVGMLAMNGVSLIASLVGGFMPYGSLGVGVFTEVWTGYMNKAFKTSEESIGWYKRIKSFDQHVKNDVIHLVNCGVKPEVLINNTTYPIGVSTIEDADKPIALDKYQTKRTIVSDDTLYAISYDKMQSDIDSHKSAIEDKKFAKALHAIAPQKNTKGAPVVATSGETSKLDSTRKAITPADIIRIKKAFDDLKVPVSERILVLSTDHVNDLLAIDQKFADQYANHATGKITNRYGFEIYEFVDCPLYNPTTGEKLAFGAVSDTATQASVAFAANKCMRADGSLKMYYKEAKHNPDTQASEVNFRKHSICMPMGTDCIGAIYSAKA